MGVGQTLPANRYVYDFYREIQCDVPTRCEKLLSQHMYGTLGIFFIFFPMSFLCLCPRKVSSRLVCDTVRFCLRSVYEIFSITGTERVFITEA